MALKGNTLLFEKAKKKYLRETGAKLDESQQEEYDAKFDSITDKTNQFTLSILFESLCQKL